MKPLLTLAAGTALLTAACSGPEHRLSDPRADKAACALYERLFELRDRGVMLGQQDALAYGHQRYEPGFSDIYDMTGDYPAVVGWEIGHVELGAPYSLDSVYFDDIRRRLPEDDAETMSDIETRVAEIFREKVASPMRVITLDVVRATMEQMGSPADFGEPRDAAQDGTEPAGGESCEPAPRRLYRSRTERSIAGICGGLAAYFDADPTLIRLVTLLLILFGGLSIWAYIILWIVIPEEPARKFNINRNR